MTIAEWNATNAGGMTLKIESARTCSNGQLIHYSLTEKDANKPLRASTLAFGKTEAERTASLLHKIQAIHDVKYPPPVKEKKKRRSFADLSGADKI